MTEFKSTEQKLEEALQRIDYMEDVLKMIGDMAHDCSSGPASWDAYWTIRQLAYDAYIGTPPALMRKE